MAWFYWFRRRWTARVRSYTRFTFGVAIPSLFMALAVVWYYGGFRGFDLTRLLSTTQLVASGPSGQCLIKGNIDDNGQRIYHLPGGYYYDFTVITESRGERWFCTETEAQAAGWRRSKL